MKKLVVLVAMLGLINGCASNPNPRSSFGEAINNIDHSSENYKNLPLAAFFYPNGALLDIRIGTMPYYWYSKDDKIVYTRPPTTMMLFETKDKYIAEAKDSTTIHKITFGGDDNEDQMKQNIKKFTKYISESQKNHVLLKVKKDGDSSTQESLNPDEVKSIQDSDRTTMNKEMESLSDIQIPYILFSYVEKADKNISMNAPLDIFKFNRNKKDDKRKYFVALYPSIYTLRLSNDLKTYAKKQSKKINGIKYNGNYCLDVNENSIENNQGNSAFEKSCPYAKFWLVNYLVTAKSIIYLDSTQAEVLSGGSFKAKYDDFSKEILKSFKGSDKNIVEIDVKSNIGYLSSLTTSYFNKKIETDTLAWSCRNEESQENGIQQQCLPSGGKNKMDGSSEIPIYAIFNLNLEHVSKMLDNAPYSSLDKIQLSPIQEKNTN